MKGSKKGKVESTNQKVLIDKFEILSMSRVSTYNQIKANKETIGRDLINPPNTV